MGSSSNWTIEAHDTTGRTFAFRPVVSEQQVAAMVAELLTRETTGGIVIYRPFAEGDNDG